MGEPAFTPGPWSPGPRRVEVIAADGMLVALVYSNKYLSRIRQSNLEHNRYLIAAAPALYDALALIDERHGGHCADPLPMDLCRRIDGALALARGEQP